MIGIHVLGAFDVRDEEISVVPSAPKSRQLYAALALRADQFVGVDDLIAELWSEPPKRAISTVQTYVDDIRRRLRHQTEPDPTFVLVGRRQSYRLECRRNVVDAYRFADRIEAAHRLVSAGRDADAVEHYGAALAMWQGELLADVPSGPLSAGPRRALYENRLLAEEERVAALERLGRRGASAALLQGLVARYPLHEGLRARLMVGLLDAGHPDAGLAVYDDLARRLASQVGAEPHPRLRHLARALRDPGGWEEAAASVMDPAPCASPVGSGLSGDLPPSAASRTWHAQPPQWSPRHS